MNDATGGNSPKTSSARLKQICAIGLTFWLSASATSAIAAPAARPNIVIILADDLGYGSVGCYGAPPGVLKTPNIDRIAQEGIRFTDASTPSSLCTPTRYGLMTGRYCWRTTLKSGVLGPFDPLLIETSRPTLASMLKQAGYSTGVIGKWHLGFGTKARQATDLSSPLSPGPLQAGFDCYFGIPQNHGENWGIYVDNEAVCGLRSTNHVEPTQPCYYGQKFMGFDAPQRDDWTAQAVLTDKAVDWIKQQSPAKPFFLYFASAAIHEPITPTQNAKGSSGAGLYGDWIRDVDISVGRILKTLDESGFGDNTLVVFTSDNGGHQIAKPMPHRQVPAPYTFVLDTVWEAQQKGLKPNGDLKGQKGTVYEGGFRVPFIARWPGHIPAKSKSGQMVCLVDMLATIAALVNVPLPNLEAGGEDSFSFLPALLGKPASKPGREALVLHSGNGVFAVRKGRWKWIEGIPAKRPSKAVPQAVEELYDISKDPAEKENVIQAHSDVVKALKTFLNATRDQGHSRIN
ncbi:MAG: arylsulfatase, partial [Verrucomicrobia bacterium]|nr:arylsulfatase [Verrucomicrobiota bacterium]